MTWVQGVEPDFLLSSPWQSKSQGRERREDRLGKCVFPKWRVIDIRGLRAKTTSQRAFSRFSRLTLSRVPSPLDRSTAQLLSTPPSPCSSPAPRSPRHATPHTFASLYRLHRTRSDEGSFSLSLPSTTDARHPSSQVLPTTSNEMARRSRRNRQPRRARSLAAPPPSLRLRTTCSTALWRFRSGQHVRGPRALFAGPSVAQGERGAT